MPKARSDIGLIGLAVMGQNLALNIADHGFQISVFNRTTEKTDKFVAENPTTPGGVIGTKTLEEFVTSLAKPRKMVILVQAGKATDAVIDGLVPLLEAGDIVMRWYGPVIGTWNGLAGFDRVGHDRSRVREARRERVGHHAQR